MGREVIERDTGIAVNVQYSPAQNNVGKKKAVANCKPHSVLMVERESKLWRAPSGERPSQYILGSGISKL